MMRRRELLEMLDHYDELLLTETDPAKVAELVRERAFWAHYVKRDDAEFDLKNKKLSAISDAADDYRAALDMLFFCARYGRPLPDWVEDEFYEIENLVGGAGSNRGRKYSARLCPRAHSLIRLSPR